MKIKECKNYFDKVAFHMYIIIKKFTISIFLPKKTQLFFIKNNHSRFFFYYQLCASISLM